MCVCVCVCVHACVCVCGIGEKTDSEVSKRFFLLDQILM